MGASGLIHCLVALMFRNEYMTKDSEHEKFESPSSNNPVSKYLTNESLHVESGKADTPSQNLAELTKKAAPQRFECTCDSAASPV